ncbi:DUF6624 domain-containing protein [Maricaulis maris]|uniref:Uncharacterized protein n=1 Tax=Maricaulis maris TaxID=74318 RepID=A0A495DN76_9PROT|nr:DUF6624 domain-containing protein [Maricaulis maris]RKR03166.1 hypothetical protein C7435_1115 [Maricaulis maris]
MSVFILATMLILQDAEAPPAPQEAPPAVADAEATDNTPAPLPTDAATLIAEFDAAYAQWGDLIAEMAARKARDRYIRDLLLSRISRSDLDPGARPAIIEATADTFNAVDQANTEWAVGLLDEHDFAALISEQPALAADIAALIQQGDLAAQRRLLELVEPFALAGDFNGMRYALLYDRIAVADDRPQRYGSRFICENGEQVYPPIEDPDTVDERRASLGLEPLAAYQERSNRFYGSSCNE